MRKTIFTFLIFIVVYSGFSESGDELVCRDIKFSHVIKTTNPPKLDGELNDSCWKQSIKLDPFVLTNGEYGKPAKYQTECQLLYDNEHLYVAFICFDDDISNMNVNAKMWDDPDIRLDDRVEIFLDINHDHRNYFELAVNPYGVQFDQKGFSRFYHIRTVDWDPTWNCFWRAKTKVYKDRWIAEIAIDVTSFGIKQINKGMTWGFNVARVRHPNLIKGVDRFIPEEHDEYSAWAYMKDNVKETITNFHSPIEFGDLVFGDPGLRITKIAFRSAKYDYGHVGYPTLFGKNPIKLWVQPASHKNNELLFKLAIEPSTTEKWEYSEKIKISADTPVQSNYTIGEDLDNKIIVELLDSKTKQQLYRTSYIVWAKPFIEFNLEPLYTPNPQSLEPISFRLQTTDFNILSESKVELQFSSMETDKVLFSDSVTDLMESNRKDIAVFDIKRLRALPGGNYSIKSILYSKMNNSPVAVFTQRLTKPDYIPSKEFHAVEGEYSFGGITNHAITVHYPFQAKFVFWRSASYVPWWDVGQVAQSNEFVECWRSGNQGCCEPMQDRECRFSRVELIKNSPTRVVVHWRYSLTDAHYKIHLNEWVDEYYTMYPDGVGVRQVNLWATNNKEHQMFEILLVKPPGVQRVQVFDEEFATLSNLNGKRYSNKYFHKNREFYREFTKKWKDFIVEVYFKDRLHTFSVFSLRDDLLPGVAPKHLTVCKFDIGRADQRGHWPTSRYQIDGYNTVSLDVPHHGNIGSINAEVNPENQPTTWTFLIGVAEEGSSKPELYARSWLYPAPIEISGNDFIFHTFDHAQRAYVFECKQHDNPATLKVKIDASKKSPIVNPVFVIKNWGDKDIACAINEKSFSQGKDFKFSHEGADLIVFINYKSKEPFKIELSSSVL